MLIYSIYLLDEDTPAPISLAAGTYWIGMRPVGMQYDRSFALPTATVFGQPMAQKSDDELVWTMIDGVDVSFCLTGYPDTSCPEANIISASPASGTLDARKPHPASATVPCYGFGMPDDPGTAADESGFYPIVIDLGVTGAEATCWTYCEYPDMSASPCGSNSIVSATDNGDGTYTIGLAHGIPGRHGRHDSVRRW